MDWEAFQNGFIKRAAEVVGELEGWDPAQFDRMVKGFGGPEALSLGEMPLQVQLGKHHHWEALKRNWKNPHLGLWRKLGLTAQSPFYAIKDKWLTSEDYKPVAAYHPWSHSVVMRAPDPLLLAHEFGHAEDQLEQEDWIQHTRNYNKDPQNRASQERLASAKALAVLRNTGATPEEMAAAKKEYESWLAAHFGDPETLKRHTVPLTFNKDFK